MALCFSNSRRARASSEDHAISESVAHPAFLLQGGLHRRAISESVVALCFAIPGGRAPPASLEAAVTITGTGCALCDMLAQRSTRGHCDIAFCRGTVLLKLGSPSFTITNTNLATVGTTDQERLFVALSFANSGARASPSPTNLATVGTTTRTAFCGTVLRKLGKPSFTVTNRLCDCLDDTEKGCRGAILCNP